MRAIIGRSRGTAYFFWDCLRCDGSALAWAAVMLSNTSGQDGAKGAK